MLITCPDLDISENGLITYEPDLGISLNGTLATHECNQGFGIIGSRTRVCLIDFINLNTSWTGDATTCSSMCIFIIIYNSTYV